MVCEAYEAGQPLAEEQKTATFGSSYANFGSADSSESQCASYGMQKKFMAQLWDAASAACAPAVQRLLDEKVNPNIIDSDGLTILSSIQ